MTDDDLTRSDRKARRHMARFILRAANPPADMAEAARAILDEDRARRRARIAEAEADGRG